jgi:hypothetical protein
MVFEKIKYKNFDWNLLLLVLFFVIIKSFTPYPYHFITMDEPKYLTLVKNFPHYFIFNKNFCLDYPPFYPFVIKIFSMVFPDYIAGLLVSQLSALGCLIMSIFLLKLFKVEKRIIYTTTIFLSFSWLLYYWSNLIYKEIFFTFLILSLFYFLFKSMETSQKKYIFISSLFGLFAAFTTDLIVFAFPVIIAGIFFYWNRCRIKKISLLIPGIVTFVGYGIWLLIRLWFYTHYTYYPIGVDGIIENVSKFNFMSIITPRDFHYTKQLTHASISFSPFNYIKYIGSIINFIPPFHISFYRISKLKFIILILFIYLPILFLIIRGIVISLKNKEWIGIFLFILLLFFISPVVYGISSPRFSIASAISMAYFFAKGFPIIEKKIYLKIFRVILPIFLVLFLFYWIFKNPYFILSLKKKVNLQKAGNFLNTLPANGVMAEFGDPPSLAYLTNKRIIGLPFDTSQIEKQVKLFKIKYVIFNETQKNKKFEIAPIYLNTINYIKNNSKKFKLLTVINEGTKKYMEIGKVKIPKSKVFIYETK